MGKSGNSIQCRILGEVDFPAWDRFVNGHPKASIYHLSVWRHILQQAFGKSWYVAGAFQDGEIRGGIPVVHLKSLFFGNFLVSMPYVNYGGLLADDDTLGDPLLDHLIQLGEKLKVSYIEFRHIQSFYSQLPVRDEKVSMWLSLPGTVAELFQVFPSKLRAQVRKGEKNALGVRIGQVELLDEFYEVFARNMRDLGTPVYSKTFFRLILETFPAGARLVVINKKSDLPVAAGFLLGYRDRLEIPWASSLRQYNSLQGNMYLYWNCLKFACEQGYRIFDFGRSTFGSSTFKFKEQWGAQPIQHYWHYHLNSSVGLPKLNPQNPKFFLAIQLWKQIPLWISKRVGPALARHLP
ncbi:MAG: hypothetical protein NPIRA03_10080 [Nitrospirales bacterium]|nr:MAG: hypothetical protein NPIRA03_10080 [Nitrospirales bacterium]